MLRDAAVSLIGQGLGFRTDRSAEIITQLQFEQTQLEAGPTKPWFLVSAETSMVTVAGDQKVSIPSGFLQEVEQAVVKYVPDDSTGPADEVDLTKDDFDENRKNFKDTDSGKPKAFSLMGLYFWIFPVPAAVYTLKTIFYSQDTVLSSNVENGWLKYVPKLLMGKAGFGIAEDLRDSHAMDKFSKWIAEGTTLLYSQNEAREHANRTYQMGGRHR